jgi:uncharacterized FlaG/YvyC family protein
MASDGNPVKIPAISLVHGSQAPITVVVQQSTGKSLPPSGNAPAAAAADTAAPAAKSAAAGAAAIQAQVTLLNKFLNDSGRPDQFRVDPTSDDKLIQQINPATGAVIGEYPVSEFPALARSVGVSGIIVDDLA